MGLEYAGVTGIDALKKWVQETPSLSNQSLEAELVKQPSDDLQRALDWSNEVNRQIEAYKGEALAFRSFSCSQGFAPAWSGFCCQLSQ